MMMKSVFWWRKSEYPEETTDLRQVTDETFHTYGLCPVRGLNLGRSGVKQSELRRDESGALAHRVTTVCAVKKLPGVATYNPVINFSLCNFYIQLVDTSQAVNLRSFCESPM